MKALSTILIALVLVGCQTPAFTLRTTHPTIPGACLDLSSNREYPQGYEFYYSNPTTGEEFRFGAAQSSNSNPALEAFREGAAVARELLVPIP